MNTLKLKFPLVAVCVLALAGMATGCDLEELCGNGKVDTGECDNPNSAEYCPADCEDAPAEGEGEGEEGGDPGEGEGEGEEGGDPGEGAGEGEGETGCTEDETQCDENGLIATCLADGAWGAAVECGAGKICVSGDNITPACDLVRDSYRWIRICSTTGRSDLEGRAVGTKPGPDIDAVQVIDSEGNEKGWVTQSGTSNIQTGLDHDWDDPVEALGEADATATGSAEGCGGFTAIGLKGFWLTVGTEFDIVPGDKIVIYEVPNCELDEDDLRSEPSRIDLSVMSVDGFWFELTAEHTGGENEYEVMADQGTPEADSQECAPCTDADCEP